MKSVLVLLLTVFFSFGCTHLNSVSTTSIPKKRSNPVSAKSEKMIVFLFNFDNSYVDEVTYDLAQQCPKGKVKGILTKHESITYFPLVLYKIKVSADGYCVR